MTDLVSYELQDSVAVVTLDDGKVNALSRQLLRDIDGALDRAVTDGAIVVLTGRPGVFSAGFDLRVLLTMPRPAIEICRQRLAPAHFNRAVVNAEVYAPDAAVDAGFLDRVVDEAQLADAARDAARQLRALDVAAHAATKLRARDKTLAAIRAAIDLDYAAATTA